MKLTELLKGKSIIPFVGAGVSMAVNDRVTGKPMFPGWQKLLLGAADRLPFARDTELIRAYLGVRPPMLLEAAAYAKQKLTGDRWRGLLQAHFDRKSEDADPKSLELARSIWRVANGLVVTTNYDRVLEWASPSPRDCESLGILSEGRLRDIKSGNIQTHTVWHMHGMFSDYPRIVLAPDEYQELYGTGDAESKYGAARDTLRHLLTSRSFLFVGSSLQDGDLANQMEWAMRLYGERNVSTHLALIHAESADEVRRSLQDRDLPVEVIEFSDYGKCLIDKLDEIAASLRGGGNPARAVGGSAPFVHAMTDLLGSLRDRFVGRDRVLSQLHKELIPTGQASLDTKRVRVHGLPGCGKTRLALEFIHRHAEQYPAGVFYLGVENPGTWNDQLRNFLTVLRGAAPSSQSSIDDTAEELWRVLAHVHPNDRMLWVLDNCPVHKSVDVLIPKGRKNVAVLETSRARLEDTAVVHIRLNVLSVKPAAKLLTIEINAKLKEEEVRAIVVSMGYLPLALHLLNRAIVTGRMSWADVVQRFGHDGTLPDAVDSSIALSYEVLGAPARTLARILALFGPEPVPTGLLSAVAVEDRESALVELIECSLLDRAPDGSVVMHRLVAASLRKRGMSSDQRRDLEVAVQALLRVFPEDPALDLSRTQQLVMSASHADAVVERTAASREADGVPGLLDLKLRRGEHHQMSFQPRAVESLREALDDIRAAQGLSTKERDRMLLRGYLALEKASIVHFGWTSKEVTQLESEIARLADRKAEFELLARQWSKSTVAADFGRAEVLAQQIERATKSGDSHEDVGQREQQVVLLQATGLNAFWTGDGARARVHLEEACGLYPKCDRRWLEQERLFTFPGAACPSHLAILAWLEGRASDALRYAEDGVRNANELNSDFHRCYAIAMRGWLHELLGDSASLLDDARLVETIAKEAGFEYWSAAAMMQNGRAALLLGNGDVDSDLVRRGRAVLNNGFMASEASGGWVAQDYQMSRIAFASLLLGEADRALEEVARAVAISDRTRQMVMRPEIERVRSWVLERIGQKAEARAALDGARALAAKLGQLALELRCLVDSSELFGPEATDRDGLRLAADAVQHVPGTYLDLQRARMVLAGHGARR